MLEDGKKPIKGITIGSVLLIITFTVALVLAVVEFSKILAIIKVMFNIIRPFLIGIGLAYVFNIPYTKIFKKLPEEWGKKRRPIAMASASFLVLFVLGATLLIVIPQVSQNFGSLINSLPQFQEDLTKNVESILVSLGIGDSIVATINQYMNEIQSFLMNFAKGLVPTVITTTINVGSFFVNSLLAIVTAIYVTASKDKMIRQLNRVLFSILPIKTYNKVLHAGKIANITFASFIGGQMIESMIIGVITYVVSVLSGMPFAPILGIIIGITNVIPYFGPFIGTGVCAFLILFVDPVKALWFIAQGVIIQQFEANIIYPRVVGSSVGLSGFWTLVGITIGGGLFGIPGMILGLPTFATFYFLFADYIRKRFNKKYKVLQVANGYPDVQDTFEEYAKIEEQIIFEERAKSEAKDNKKNNRKKSSGDKK